MRYNELNEEIKILSIQMGSYYDYKLNNRKSLDIGKAVLDYSLFSEFMSESGMIVNKRNKTYDFIMCKFDYGSNDMNKTDLRNKYYIDGFTINWDEYFSTVNSDDEDNKKISKSIGTITYRRLMRSIGKAKEGDCIFVNEDLYDKASNYINMGIELPVNSNRVVEIAAYNTMTCANMINSIRIPLKNILVLEDEEVKTLAKVVTVKTKINTHLEGNIDYKEMEEDANTKGYTFYKKNEKVTDGFDYIEDRKIANLESLGITIIKKKTGKKNVTKDFKAMEGQANSLGYTFYNDNEDYTFIKSSERTKEYLTTIGIDIIEIETETDAEILDFEAMESFANEKGLSFYKKGSNNPNGYKMLDRNIFESALNSPEKLKKLETEIGLNVKFKDDFVITVEDNECFVERSEEPKEVSNIMWDGMGLIDHSLMPNDCTGFVYLRNHMTKVCCFDGEVIQFLKDRYGDEYETATREDMFGNFINVRDIRLITTNNAIKWIGKFEEQMGGDLKNAYKYYDEFLKKYDYKFAVVKTAHKSKYGNLQRSSFQGNNSLPCLDKDDLTNIAKTSIDYIDNLKTDDESFLKYLESTATNYNINYFMVDLARKFPDVMKTKEFSKKRNFIISKFKREEVMLGKLLQEADNLTIAGNVYALLLKTVNDDWMKDPTLNVIDDGIQCYTSRFKDGEHLAGYRNPHNSPNNYGYYINHYSKEMEQYFPNLGDNVICMNMIGTDNQSRLNGHDMDTDFAYITNQLETIKYSKICYDKYPTIVNEIPKVTADTSDEDKTKYGVTIYQNTPEGLALMDSNIAKYQTGIGESSNLAQLALSYYWDKLAKEGIEDKQLEDVYIICSVLAQCYIDSAKRTFMLDLNKEMIRLRGLECMDMGENKYPEFYAKTQLTKLESNPKDSLKKKKEKKEAISKINVATNHDCHCPMDLLAKIIDKEVVDLRGTNKDGCLNIQDFIVSKKDIKVKNRHQKDIIKEIINSYDDEMKELQEEKDEDNYKQKAMLATDKALDKLKNINIPRENMYKFVLLAFGIEKDKSFNKFISDRILVILYNYDKKKGTNRLMSLFKNPT